MSSTEPPEASLISASMIVSQEFSRPLCCFAFVVLLLLPFLACTTSTGPDEGAGAGTEARTIRGGPLLDLADLALSRGEVDAARGRYERVLTFDARSAHAHLGLGRVALLEDRLEDARFHLKRAGFLAADLPAVPLAMADLEARRGDLVAARRELDRALVLDPGSAAAHQQYLDLTGPAPLLHASSVDEARELARAHPYDPRARVVAGGWLEREGRVEEAVAHFVTAVWLADLDPASGRQAFRRLAALDANWARRSFVPVYSVADERVRAEPGWKFRLRNQWRFASGQLAKVLDAHFVPVSIESVSFRGAATDLETLLDRSRDQFAGIPARGIFVAFTGRRAARRPGAKVGLAEFLGRSLIVRFPQDERHSRVLLHELFHIYGGIHVADDFDSIMNPAGGAFSLDPLNYAIVREMRVRDFRRGGMERNVLPRIDVSKAIDVYLRALRANLLFRKLGTIEALEARKTSRFIARDKLREAQALDPHHADVSRTVATLLLAADRPAEALVMLDFASELFGSDSRRGREAERHADALRRALQRKYGLEAD